MRRYETIVIIDPDISDDDRTTLFTRVQELIPQQKGVLIEEDLWGARKLAYAIKNKPRGFYARYDYCGMGALVDELERTFRIDDRVLKYMTVQMDDKADPDAILAELAASKTAAEAPPADQTPPEAVAETPPERADETAAPVDQTADAEAAQPADDTSEKE